MIRTVALIAIAAMLSSCASGPPRMSNERIERALAGAPGAAQPGRIVAAELAFARAARDDGQWTAFRAFVAPGGLLHGRNGPIGAEPWLAAQADPEQAVQWAPRAVWMSCDGRLAISRGRFLDPDGMVGTFVTVWQQQPDREYRWIYDIGAPDDPQPVPDPSTDAPDAIVVSAEDIVQGYVADCPRAANPLATPPIVAVAESTRHGGGASPDGTLRWRWEHAADGTRRFVADYFADGAWQQALGQAFAPASAD